MLVRYYCFSIITPIIWSATIQNVCSKNSSEIVNWIYILFSRVIYRLMAHGMSKSLYFLEAIWGWIEEWRWNWGEVIKDWIANSTHDWRLLGNPVDVFWCSPKWRALGQFGICQGSRRRTWFRRLSPDQRLNAYRQLYELLRERFSYFCRKFS